MEMEDNLPPPSVYTLPSDTTQEVIITIVIDTNPTGINKNSLMPRADIPLASSMSTPSANSLLLASIAELLKPINECLKTLKVYEQYHTKEEGQMHTNVNTPAFKYDQMNNNFKKQCASWAIQNPGKDFENEFDLSNPQDAKVWADYNEYIDNSAKEKDTNGFHPFNPTAFTGNSPSLLCSDSTPTFSHSAPSIYTPTYETPDTWDCITIVSDFPDVIPAHPLNILPRIAPEPVTI
jgi:hypothetical protein